MRKTEVIPIDIKRPEPGAIQRAAALVQQGGLVAFPTETVYGLGANALNAEAVRRIFEAKGRPSTNPLIVHVANYNAARDLAADWPDIAQRLAEQFWPGSLTLIVPRCEVIPDVVTAGGPTVALRVPAHPVALALLQAANVPLAAPSANRSNRLSPTRAEHVFQDLDGRIDMILNGGPAWGGLESTVLDVTTTPPRLLRPGLITPAQLEAVIGPIIRLSATAEISAGSPARSPGLMGKHYAPHAPLECVDGSGDERVAMLVGQGLRVGWLCFGQRMGSDLPGIVRHAMSNDAAKYAASLYCALHELDAAGVDRIVVELPPVTEEWLAVHDRLRRAAGN